jgi:hypothetical protein
MVKESSGAFFPSQVCRSTILRCTGCFIDDPSRPVVQVDGGAQLRVFLDRRDRRLRLSQKIFRLFERAAAFLGASPALPTNHLLPSFDDDHLDPLPPLLRRCQAHQQNCEILFFSLFSGFLAYSRLFCHFLLIFRLL